MQVRTTSEILRFFNRPRRIKLLLFVEILLNKIFIIRREYKPEDLLRPEVATNLQLNQKFWSLFII